MNTHPLLAGRRGLAFSSALAMTLAVALVLPARAAPAFVSTQPAPRTEHWQQREAAIDRQLRDLQALAAVKLVFVGDSITDFWLLAEDPWVPGRQFGRRVWDESFGAQALPGNRALNIGISGDRIEHLLHRIRPKAQGGRGQLQAMGLKPDFIVLLIGINNSWAAETPVVDSIVEGVRAVLRSVHQRQPQARIVLQSLLPTSEAARQRDVVLPVNQRLALLAASAEFAPHTVYLDLVPGFVNDRGEQIGALFTDGLHPNEAGYRVWRDRLLPFLEQQRVAKAR